MNRPTAHVLVVSAWTATTVLAVALAVFGRNGWWACVPLAIAFAPVWSLALGGRDTPEANSVG